MAEKFEPRDISQELKDSYLDYAMSVIISRALPDSRDGLKPVQRRIIYALKELGLYSNAKFRKSAAVVGEVLAKYHPHGDLPVYEALVRMAQDFSLRYPLILGQGNFGSIDGDPPAAMRYSEAKMSAICEEMVKEIDEETVDFVPNYDGTREEPVVLPSAIPQLLLNGAMGIAVGMATTILPHNLEEVVDAACYLLDHKEATSTDLMKFIKGPDFPTAGLVYGRKNIEESYALGKGPILVRAKAEITEEGKTPQIVITELPYMVNKAELIAKITQLVEEKRIEGIKDLRDESDKEGLRVVIDLKSDAIAGRVLNQLYRFTDLEKTFHINMIALIDKGIQPAVLSIKELLEEYLNHRIEIVTRRTQFRLKKAKERAHILEGLAKALDHIDEIIKLIKTAEDRADAQTKLIKKYDFTEIQANAILDMKLANLAKLEREKVENELKEKRLLIKEYELILSNPKKVREIIKNELLELKKKYPSPRRTQIIDHLPEAISEEELIASEDTLITISQTGYIKRMSPEVFRAQKRGGRGVMAYEQKNGEDFIEHILTANTRDEILFFTDYGKVYKTQVYEIAEGNRLSRGRAIQNFLNLPPQEKITAILSLNKEKMKEAKYLVMATKNGLVKRTPIEEYRNLRRNGLLAINLLKDDRLESVSYTSGSDDLLLITKLGQSIRFKETDIRPTGRVTAGVCGIKLKKGDEVILMVAFNPKEIDYEVLTVSANAYGKRTKIKEYRRQKRGGGGVKTFKVTSKTGEVVSGWLLKEAQTLIAISSKGQSLKLEINAIPLLGRLTQGVRLMKLESDDRLAGITLL